MPDTPPRSPSLRDLAKMAGVSHNTIHLALRNDPQLPVETRLRLQKLAEEVGYRPKAILATAMAHMRRGFPAHLRSNIAIICIAKRDPVTPWIAAKVAGATSRAQSLGYGVERFVLTQDDIQNYDKIFRTRAIQGAVILGGLHEAWPSCLNIILKDYPIAMAGTGSKGWPRWYHEAKSRPYSVGFNLAWHVIWEGYHKLGVCINDFLPNRELRNGIFARCESMCMPPPITFDIIDHSDSTDKEFLQWFEKEQPDSIITSSSFIRTPLERSGVKIPEEVSLYHWNIPSRETDWSGWDPRNHQLGAAAVDLVIGQIHRGEKGKPDEAMEVDFRGCFFQGSTSRQGGGVHPSWRRSYPLAEKMSSTAWHPVHFENLQNGNYGMWRSPLDHFSPGKKVIHGIPFSITDSQVNHDCNCLVVGLGHCFGLVAIPRYHACIPVRRVAAGVYFLHLAYVNHNAKRVWQLSDFPEYVITFNSSRQVTVPLGVHHPERFFDNSAALMDWWPHHKAHDFPPRARFAKVTSPNHYDDYERNLYTLEWINPHANEKIKSIELRVPENSPVGIVLLAVTLGQPTPSEEPQLKTATK